MSDLDIVELKVKCRFIHRIKELQGKKAQRLLEEKRKDLAAFFVRKFGTIN
jgi:hypothetical protein